MQLHALSLAGREVEALKDNEEHRLTPITSVMLGLEDAKLSHKAEPRGNEPGWQQERCSRDPFVLLGPHLQFTSC